MGDRYTRYNIGGVVVPPRRGAKLRGELKLCLRAG